MACPEHLAHGGHAYYADGDDSFQVPGNTPLTYNFNILDCQSDYGVLKKNIKVFHDKIVAQQDKEKAELKKKMEEEKKQEELDAMTPKEKKAMTDAEKAQAEKEHEDKMYKEATKSGEKSKSEEVKEIEDKM